MALILFSVTSTDSRFLWTIGTSAYGQIPLTDARACNLVYLPFPSQLECFILHILRVCAFISDSNPMLTMPLALVFCGSHGGTAQHMIVL